MIKDITPLNPDMAGRSGTAAAPDDSLTRIIEARHHDPFEVLGRHARGSDCLVRAYLPHCSAVRLDGTDIELHRIEGTDLFEWQGDADRVPQHYRLSWVDRDGLKWSEFDPYCFSPQLGDLDLHLFGEGRHLHAYRMLGAHPARVGGVTGTRFAV